MIETKIYGEWSQNNHIIWNLPELCSEFFCLRRCFFHFSLPTFQHLCALCAGCWVIIFFYIFVACMFVSVLMAPTIYFRCDSHAVLNLRLRLFFSLSSYSCVCRIFSSVLSRKSLEHITIWLQRTKKYFHHKKRLIWIKTIYNRMLFFRRIAAVAVGIAKSSFS